MTKEFKLSEKSWTIKKLERFEWKKRDKIFWEHDVKESIRRLKDSCSYCVCEEDEKFMLGQIKDIFGEELDRLETKINSQHPKTKQETGGELKPSDACVKLDNGSPADNPFTEKCICDWSKDDKYGFIPMVLCPVHGKETLKQLSKRIFYRKVCDNSECELERSDTLIWYSNWGMNGWYNLACPPELFEIMQEELILNLREQFQ